MSTTHTVGEFEVRLPATAPSKFDSERAAFYRLLPDLLSEHAGKYVAIHEGQVVAVADDRKTAAHLAWDRAGYCDIFVELVSVEPRRPSRLPHVRELGRDDQP